MTNDEIVKSIDHRPYSLPRGPWVMKQIWHDLLFAHWEVSLDELFPLIPKGLELDLWDGKPWISIVPFHMSGIRLRGLPPIPFTNRFPEMNVRTYVTCNGKPGVYFFSLEASNRLAVETARLLHLPYMNAKMSVTFEAGQIGYSSERVDRRGRPAKFLGTYKPVDSNTFHAEPKTLIHWLTERYCLYTSNRKGKIKIGEIHHMPWGLQDAELHIKMNTMAESHGIVLDDAASLLTFTKRLEVLIWPIRKVL